MKTKTYDLNLWVNEGSVHVLAHQLTEQNGNITTDGNTFTEIFDIPATRKNASMWRPLLDYFDEPDLYDELDAWSLTAYADHNEPQHHYTQDELGKMPELLRDAINRLPEYEVL